MIRCIGSTLVVGVATLMIGMLVFGGVADAHSPASPVPPPGPVTPTTTLENPPEPTTTPQRPPITTSTPTTPPGEPPANPPRPRTCASFGSQNEAQRYYETIRPVSPDAARLLDRDGDGRACASRVDRGEEAEPRPVPEGPEIGPTDDDGSSARISGDQVREVPEGSIDTGAAR